MFCEGYAFILSPIGSFEWYIWIVARFQISIGSMTYNVITLYDVPSTVPQPWAPHIWRIRLILNYKRLPYRTVWIELSDVETTLRSIGAPPTSVRSDGRPVYTLPVIVDPLRSRSNPTILSNPDSIADYLEGTYPARPVYPEGSRALQLMFVRYLQEVFSKPLLPILVPLSYQRLPDRVQAHFHSTGQIAFPPLSGSQREQAWGAVKQQFDALATMMDQNAAGDGDGVVAMGHEVSYADFVLCSMLIWIEKVSPQDGWLRVRQWNGGRWARLHERCRAYMDVY
ncbi:GST N-terminal domain-containing protein [Abortiporus biennis]